MTSDKDPGVLGIYGFHNRVDYSYERMTIATGSADSAGLSTFGYLPSSNVWQTYQAPTDAGRTGATMVVLDSSLHMLDCKDSTSRLACHQAYQALFTVFIPIVRKRQTDYKL